MNNKHVNEKNVVAHLQTTLSPEWGLHEAWEDVILAFRRTSGDGKFEGTPTRGLARPSDARSAQRFIIHAGKSDRSVLIEHALSGLVCEIAVKNGIAKRIGIYNDIEDAARESFTSDEIDKHVRV